MRFDAAVFGAGVAGCVCARELVERGHRKVILFEKEDHIGGFSDDYTDAAGVLVHRTGPHVFHTKIKRVWDYVGRFATWRPYHHIVEANVRGTYVPVPFNLNSIHRVFGPDKAARIESKLVATFGMEAQVAIMELLKSEDPELREVAEWVYENIFKGYTMKQWGKKPEEISGAVTARVPVTVSRRDGYFTDPYEAMPVEGYHAFFERLLDHPDITVELKTDAASVLKIVDGQVFLKGERFEGPVFYTGPLDELFAHDLGRLPYRTVEFELETLEQDSFQHVPVVHFPVSEAFTRITEYKKFTGPQPPGRTTIAREYPRAYEETEGRVPPSYPIDTPASAALYAEYAKRAKAVPNLHVLGRLGLYKYFNMDLVVDAALKCFDELWPVTA